MKATRIPPPPPPVRPFANLELSEDECQQLLDYAENLLRASARYDRPPGRASRLFTSIRDALKDLA